MEQVKLEKEEKKAAKLARKENAHAQTPPAIVLPHLLPKATQFQLLEPSTESSCMHVAMAHQLGVPMGMLPPRAPSARPVAPACGCRVRAATGSLRALGARC